MHISKGLFLRQDFKRIFKLKYVRITTVTVATTILQMATIYYEAHMARRPREGFLTEHRNRSNVNGCKG